MKICVFTLGCKVNFYESDGIINELKDLGYEVTNKLEYADIYILNTCAVTNEGERKSRQLISRVKNLNPEAKILVCGCASQHNKQQFVDKNVSVVMGNGFKSEIVNFINNQSFIDDREIPKSCVDEMKTAPQRVRAYLKVQDGCNNFCSYCLIPYVRGRSRSRKLENIISEAKYLENFCGDIVLTGINLSDFKPSLIELVESLKDIKSRIRFGSLEVNIITVDFMERLSKINNICPHFHLSLQSGSNDVLKQMNRHYTKEEYLQKVDLIRKYYPFASITTHLIVGFPNETEENFLESIQTCKNAKFFNIHCFPYSKREGTKASLMPQILNSVKKQRVKVVEELNEKLFLDYIELLKTNNVKQNVLLEEVVEINNKKYFVGHSEYYVKCYVDYDNNLKENDIVEVMISEKFYDGVK